MKIDDRLKKYIFNGCIIVAAGVIAYFGLSQHCGTHLSKSGQQSSPAAATFRESNSIAQQTNNNQVKEPNVNNTNQEVSPQPTVQPIPTVQAAQTPQQATLNAQKNSNNKTTNTNTTQVNQTKQPEPDKNAQVNTNNTQTASEQEQKPAQQTAQTQVDGLKIPKSEVTTTAKFYPYKIDNTYMEVIAVKASDGTIRTALNTCQVCYDSGKGYYQQVGEYLVCQNCKNKFHIDQVEKVKGGCNPVPILAENKNDTQDTIIVPKEFLTSKIQFFSKWKKF